MDTSRPRPCAAAATLDVVGERWSLLVVRELFYGVRRFDGIQRATGAPRNMLSARLKTLEQAGVVTRTQYLAHPPRYEYTLTAAGRELVPVLLTLQQWGERHLPGSASLPLRHSPPGTEGHLLEPYVACAACGRPAVEDELALAAPDPWAVGTPSG